jgi:glycosyltransferase involved in cell wall biosynthesis
MVSVTTPRVTWLLPVKNNMPFLPETLASIESQTYKNWEILVWDNGSTDGSVEELRRWIPARLPGRVVADEPLCLPLSLARLVETAQTELCAVINADDVNFPQRLEQQVAFLTEHPEVGVVGANVEFIDADSRFLSSPDPYPGSDAEIRWQMHWENPMSHPASMYRRAAVLQAGNYQPYDGDRVTEAMICDYDLWFRMALRTEFANLPQVLLKYRKHRASASSQSNPSYFIYFDIVAQLNAGCLFTGLGAAEALELRQKTKRDASVSLSVKDFQTYRQAAVATAVLLGKPRDYFRSTAAYRRQFKELARNYLLQRPAGRAVMGLKRLLR